MKMKQDIRSITYLKSRAADLLSQINETGRPVIITQNGAPRGVLQDPAAYEAMKETIAMLKLVAMGEADVRARRVKPHAAVMTRAQSLLTRRKRQHGRRA